MTKYNHLNQIKIKSIKVIKNTVWLINKVKTRNIGKTDIDTTTKRNVRIILRNSLRVFFSFIFTGVLRLPQLPHSVAVSEISFPQSEHFINVIFLFLINENKDLKRSVNFLKYFCLVILLRKKTKIDAKIQRIKTKV